MSEIIVEKICRLCLNDSFPMSNIFHDLSTKGILLYAVLNFVYDLEITRNDGLPVNICSPCLCKLTEFENCKINAHFAKKELVEMIRKMEATVSLEHFDEMEIIPAGKEKSISQELTIKSEKNFEEITIPAEQNEIRKITEMEATASLEHFEEMEIIPAGKEKNTSQELTIKSEKNFQEITIPEEQNEIWKITKMEATASLEHFDEMKIIPAGEEKSTSQELTIKSEKNFEEITIPAEQNEIWKITEMEATAYLEHFDEMEIIPAGKEKNTSQEFLGVGRRMECFHCGEKRETKQEIAQHIEDAHNSIFNEDNTPIQQQRYDKKHTCSLCEISFKDKSVLARHMFIHTGEKPFQCNVCTYRCSRRRVLKVHMRKHTGEKPFQCNICNFSFSQSGTLKVHMRIHSGEKPFLCNVCNYSCSTNQCLKIHMRKHTGEKPFLCHVCNYSCSTSGNLKVHMRKHTGEKPFLCNVCNYSCSQREHLKVHMLKHPGEKLFLCHVCNYSCSKSPRLKVHMQKHTEEKPFLCNVCNYSCFRHDHLKVHMRTHTGEKPFLCHVCNYSCSTSGYLKVHMRKHTGEKPFLCNVCNYSCSQSENLKAHMRTHTGEKPFLCNVCNYSCSQRKNLKVHMRKHTGEKPL